MPRHIYKTAWSSIIRGSIIICGAVAAVLVLNSAFSFFPSDVDKVRNLQVVFPIIEKYEVKYYKNESGCKKIEYMRGRFSNDRNSRCNWYDGRGPSFDKQAERDFEVLAKALATSGLNVRWLDEVQFDSSSKIRYGHFYLSCFLCKKRYVYSPNPAELPGEVPGELWVKRINYDWYTIDESWN